MGQAGPACAVLLDVGDTLVHWGVPKAERFAWFCTQSGVCLPDDSALVRQAAIAGERVNVAAFPAFDVTSEAHWQTYFVTAFDVLGLPPAMAEPLARERAVAQAPWWVDPAALPTLRELRRRGYRVGLVSIWDGTLDRLCQDWAFTDLVNVIADSHVVGMKKPDPAIFAHTLAALGVRPEHALHVGDTYDADVLGARAAGIRPVLLDSLGHELRACTDRITSLPMLLDLCPVVSAGRLSVVCEPLAPEM